jgi:hypothetical protein
MPDVNIVRVNRVPYSWNSCSHFFNGLPYKGLTAVSYKESREVKLVHGAQQDGTPLGITAGIYKVENTSFTLLRDSATALMQDLTIAGLGSFGDAEFTYILSVFEPVSPPSLPVQTVLTGCRITGVEEKHVLGADELVTEISVQAMFLLRTAGGVPMNLWSTVRSLL